MIIIGVTTAFIFRKYAISSMDTTTEPPTITFLASSFYVTLFDILQGSLFSLLLLVFLTAQFSSIVNRSKTWFVFIGSTTAWCASYLLLIGQQIGEEPSVGYCTVQAALIYSSNPFAVSAALALELELFIKLETALSRLGTVSEKWTQGLVLFPVFVYLIVFIWAVSVGISHPDLVEREATNMFCHIKVSPEIGLAQPFVVSATVTLLVEILVVVFSVWTNIILFHHKRKTGVFPSENSSPFSMSAFIRRNALMTALTVLGIIMATTSFVESGDPNFPAWNLSLTAMPICTFLLFGTRTDLLRVWFCLGTLPDQKTEISSV
ncbi:hypothetical protein EV421DRAFT_1800509 [Armillaria borealis]|uniref:Uncharacterized protein n=1 Tax=Armillaria borealis TaxID=47425 RepID=A0AA39JLY2_9AGAR|nr:hypothetical protein EV421DRAFT_1800509 [Armillaria borealis]